MAPITDEERNKQIIELHMNEEHALSLSEIGRRFGISRERVRQIIKAAGHETQTGRRIAEATYVREVELARKRLERENRPYPHGTRYGYINGCRCRECREANNMYSFVRYHSGRTPPSHGVSGYINFGCKCDICRKAHNDYQREYKLRRKQRENGG